ncbi:hypothetical protein CUD01_03090 [Cellulomonas uda]|uniref:Uncharacterized protein n=1 Tax=Cellulomonas uda TaxID=1714 RepID=A0A4Y3KA56_CELUD|nr:hypothetical protein CUD01_03090 [Cellulomonas uda]
MRRSLRAPCDTVIVFWHSFAPAPRQQDGERGRTVSGAAQASGATKPFGPLPRSPRRGRQGGRGAPQGQAVRSTTANAWGLRISMP